MDSVTGLGVVIAASVVGLVLLVSLLRTFQEAAQLPTTRCGERGRWEQDRCQRCCVFATVSLCCVCLLSRAIQLAACTPGAQVLAHSCRQQAAKQNMNCIAHCATHRRAWPPVLRHVCHFPRAPHLCAVAGDNLRGPDHRGRAGLADAYVCGAGGADDGRSVSPVDKGVETAGQQFPWFYCVCLFVEPCPAKAQDKRNTSHYVY